MNITVIDHGGGRHAVSGRPGASLMEAVRDAGLPIAAQCGGCCSCATCHVYVDEAYLARLPPMSEEEEALLELGVELRPSSRLSCQLPVSDDLNGMTIELAPGTEI